MNATFGKIGWALIAGASLLAVGTTTAIAGPPRGYVYDNRFDHGRYYPRPGYSVGELPRGHLSLRYGSNPYYFHEGVWFRPYGPRYVVARPPFGIVVPLLPAWYTTVWFGGTPYYYADGTYYLWQPESQGYVVTEPPASNDTASTAPPATDSLYAYPRSGQSESQQANDRYECYDWARKQSGFDPTQALGGVSGEQVASRRADYLRAQKTCLEGRGYSVN